MTLQGDGELVVYESRAMDFTAGRLAAEEFLSLPGSRWPDAVFAANDLIALGVLQALTMRGVSVPDDVALVGYDDIEFAGSAAIPLTSIRQPAQAVGEKAVAILLEEIGDPSHAKPRHVTLSPELVVRASTDNPGC